MPSICSSRRCSTFLSSVCSTGSVSWCCSANGYGYLKREKFIVSILAVFRSYNKVETFLQLFNKLDLELYEILSSLVSLLGWQSAKRNNTPLLHSLFQPPVDNNKFPISVESRSSVSTWKICTISQKGKASTGNMQKVLALWGRLNRKYAGKRFERLDLELSFCMISIIDQQIDFFAVMFYTLYWASYSGALP